MQQNTLNGDKLLADLDAALNDLRQAAPDPIDVQSFTAETIRKRDYPHTFESLFVRGVFQAGGTVICKLCGMSTLENQTVINLPEHPATIHVNWHNAMHRAGVAA